MVQQDCLGVVSNALDVDATSALLATLPLLLPLPYPLSVPFPFLPPVLLPFPLCPPVLFPPDRGVGPELEPGPGPVPEPIPAPGPDVAVGVRRGGFLLFLLEAIVGSLPLLWLCAGCRWTGAGGSFDFVSAPLELAEDTGFTGLAGRGAFRLPTLCLLFTVLFPLVFFGSGVLLASDMGSAVPSLV
jgi:hypothetical protein